MSIKGNTPGYKNIEHFYDIIRDEDPNGKEELQKDQARKQYILQLEELANERSKALEDPSAGAIDFLNIYRSLIDNIKLKVANFFTSNESKSLTQNNIRLSLHDIMPKILDEKYKSMEILMIRKNELQQELNSEDVDDEKRNSITNEIEEIQKKIDEEVILLYKLSEVKSEQDLSNIMGNKSYSASSPESKEPKKPSLLSKIFKKKPKPEDANASAASAATVDADGKPIPPPEKKSLFSRFTRKKSKPEDANGADAAASAAPALGATGNAATTPEKKSFRNFFKSKPKSEGANNLQNVVPAEPTPGPISGPPSRPPPPPPSAPSVPPSRPPPPPPSRSPPPPPIPKRAPPPLPPPRAPVSMQVGGNKTRKYGHYIHDIKQNRKELFNKEMEIINSIRKFKHGRHVNNATQNKNKYKNMKKRFITSVKK